MYRRDIFLQEGEFLEGLWPEEDVELDYRIRKKGYKIVFNPRAVVYHYRPKTLRSFLKMMHRYGHAQGFLVRRYGIFRKIQILPFVNLLILPLLIYSLSLKLFGLISWGMILLFLFCFSNFNIYVTGLKILGFITWNIGFWRRFMLYFPFSSLI